MRATGNCKVFGRAATQLSLYRICAELRTAMHLLAPNARPIVLTVGTMWRMRAGSAPRAPRWGRRTPPNPLQVMLAA
jgi:hypothetical protein